MPLFLCYTPLHALIAKRIIKTQRLKKCIVVYLCFKKTDKHLYYFDQLSKESTLSFFFTLKHSSISDVLSLVKIALKIKKILPAGEVVELFTGNIKHFHSRFLMFLLGIKVFNTFDDGAGNICGEGYFYDLSERKGVRSLFALLSPRLIYSNVVENINAHYSIYEFDNVYSPVKRISILDNFHFDKKDVLGKRVVYLAGVFSQEGLMSEDEELKMDEVALKKWSVTDVLTHPRSCRTSHFDRQGVSLIKTKLVAEDYILSLIKAGYEVTCVGIYCSALLNLQGIPNLNLVNIQPPLNRGTEGIDRLFLNANIESVSLKGDVSVN